VVREDDELISRAKQGDSEAWRALYQAHAARLVVWLDTPPSRDAAVQSEDLAAEAWLTSAGKIAEFQGTSEQFAGWIFGIARNLSRNATRRSNRRGTDPTDELDRPSSDDLEGLLAGRDWVRRALARLPEREREVVACLDVVGLDVAQTARALDMSPVAVRVAHHRGLRKLRMQPTAPTAEPDQPSASSSAAR
jgi:RNA polymerase sigma-70 factor (ECF subfamily)